MKIAFLTLAIGLASCVSPSTNEKALQATEYACASATAALKTAILFNDKLSAGTRSNVTQAVQVINPICSQETLPTLSSTSRAALDGALTQLTFAAAEASK